MNESLSDAIKEAFAVAPANVVVIHTLQVKQEGVQSSIYLAQSRQAFSAYDEDGVLRHFEASGFVFSLPPSSQEGFQSLNIAIDNIGRRVTDFLKAAKSQRQPVEIIYRPYLSTDLSQPQMDPPLVLYLKDVEANAIQVTGRATFMDVVNKKHPSLLYTREQFPALG